ncbi:hypothetical protein B224_4809 [Aeromonas media WS]|nr:hypothetical protein B224_4809 [Aeromonas media WS]
MIGMMLLADRHDVISQKGMTEAGGRREPQHWRHKEPCPVRSSKGKN